MAVSSGLTPISKILEDQAGFADFEREVEAIASMIEVTGEPYGLLAQVQDPALYNLLDGVDPNFVRAPPAALAAGAGNGAVAIYKELMDEYKSWQLWSKRLKLTIYMGLSKTLQLDVTNPEARIVTMTTLGIMTHLRGLFAAPTATFITDLKADLKKPLVGSDLPTFIHHTSRFVQVVARLAAVNTVVNMDDQMLLFQQSCQGQPAATDAINDYIKLNPIHQQRNLQAMIAYLRLQLANITTAGGGFAGSTFVSTRSNVSPAQDVRLIHAVVREMRRQNLVALHLPPTPPALPSSTRAPPAASASARIRNYCYAHGYGVHAGATCVTMRNRPMEYNQQMIAATSPNDVAGGHP